MKRIAIACVALAGCSSMDWMGAPNSPDARDIATLSWLVLGAFSAVVIVVWLILAFLVARRRRGTFSDHAPHTLANGMGWIWTWGLIIPGLLFAGALAGGIAVMFAAGPHMHGVARPDIIVTGHQWWWEVRYTGDTPEQWFTTANEIHIPVGKPVNIELRSADVIHSFWVPQLQGKVDLVPGESNAIQLQADVPGRYDGQCAEFCGAQHGMMRLVVMADSQLEYEAWRFQQHAPALAPREEPEIRGAEVFEKRACGLCHTVRGSRALGTVGPDLTHLASRAMIGASSIPNDRARLQAWVTRAHSLKPEIRMPNLFTFTGEDLNALAIYLRSLQ